MADTPEQFAARIRKVYNSYVDVPDVELAKRMVEKHPEYKDRVDFTSVAKSAIDTAIAPIDPVATVQSPIGQAALTPLPPAVKSGEGWNQMGEQMRKANPIPEPIEPATSSPAAMLQSMAHLAGQLPGLASKGIGAVVGQLSAADVVTMGALSTEKTLLGLLQKRGASKGPALLKLAEADPIRALKSGIDVQDWGKVDDWLAELKASAPSVTEAEWEPVIAARAKTLVNEVNGLVPAEQLPAPMPQGLLAQGPVPKQLEQVPSNIPQEVPSVLQNVPTQREVALTNLKKANEVRAFKKEMSSTPNVEPWAANKVLEVLDDPKTPARMPKEGFLNVLRNKQVKPEQLEWDGLNDFLKGKETITKADVRKFVEENGLHLTEIDKGDGPLGSTLFFKEQGYTPETFNALPSRDQARLWEAYDLMKDAPEYKSNATSYGHMKDLQEPGGKNYREKRFQLPMPKNAAPMEVIPDEVEKILADYDGGRLDDNLAQKRARTVGYELNWDKETDLPYVVPKDKVPPVPFKSGAYPEEGIVAETRYTDRKIGKKNVMFLEEVQSHMHQAGREQGYLIPKEVARSYVAHARYNELVDATTPFGTGGTQEQRDEAAQLLKELRAYSAKTGGGIKGIPDAPFKAGKHVELVMKRMVRQAIEEGKDGIAWTTGKMQKDRYALSNWVKRIEFRQSKQKPGTFDYQLYKTNGDQWVSHSAQTPEQIDATIGKGWADKMKARVEERAQQRAKGIADPLHEENNVYKDGLALITEGVELGGKWADNLYDQQMVNFANKQFGKYGAKVVPTKMTFQPDKPNMAELEEEVERVMTGNDTFDEAQETFKQSFNWPGLTEEVFEDLTNTDPGRKSTVKQWARFLSKEITKPIETTVPYMEFTDALKRVALKKGFSMYAKPVGIGLGTAGVTRAQQE